MTTARAQYLLHILEKIGTPLLSSVKRTEDGADAHGTQAAKAMASLLAKTVELSIALGNAADVFDGTDDDDLRVALAAIAGPIIADHYTQDKKIPDDDTIKKIVTGLESALTFSENFTPSTTTNDTLASTEDGTPAGLAAKPIQNLYFLKAILPVIHAVSRFAFGQSEQKLVTEIGARLTSTAEKLRGNLFPVSLGEDEKKASDLVTLRAVAELYASCHVAETERLSRAGGSDAEGTIQNVWMAFDQQVALLETLAQTILDPTNAPQASTNNTPEPITPASAPVTPPIPNQSQETNKPTDAPQKPAIFGGSGNNKSDDEAKAPETPPATPSESTPTATPLPPTTEQPKTSSPPAGANPMGFFSKKDNPEDDAAAEPTVTPAQPEPAPQSPTPQQETPLATPDNNKTEDKTSSDSGSGTGGNPMSFFAGKKDDDE